MSATTTETAANRIGTVLLALGVLLIAGGWLAALSDIGAATITAGLTLIGLAVVIK